MIVMSRSQFDNCSMATAAFFLIIAALEFTEPVPDCLIKGRAWALWLCLSFVCAGAGFSQRPMRGAAIGLAVGLIPCAMAGMLADLCGMVGVLALPAMVVAVVIFNAVWQTIRGE